MVVVQPFQKEYQMSTTPTTIPIAQAQAVFDALILALEAKAGPLQKLGLEFLRTEVDGGGLAAIIPFLTAKGFKVA